MAELSLDISPNRNEKLMRVYDMSQYCDDDKITNYLLEVLPVNKSTWIVFPIQKYFSVTLNSSNLQYRKVSLEADLIELPDGIYEFKLSYKPNIQTLTKFYHLRATKLINKVKSQRNELMKNKCDYCRNEYEENLGKLRDILEFVDGAQWAVEECHDKEKGKEMYEWATKLLEQYANNCQC